MKVDLSMDSSVISMLLEVRKSMDVDRFTLLIQIYKLMDMHEEVKVTNTYPNL